MSERAVYYCRVSTEEDNQITSIIHQREESIRIIQEMGWELVDGYVDEGKSGTTTRYRNEYNRMMQDMEKSRFDILVVKSQDRLMRNTREWYLFLDKLTGMKKRLYFYLERKFYSTEDALLTGIKAILAEDYSRSLSRNINNAHERRQRSGSSVILTSRTWGYDKVGKEIVVNETEAEMVRLIYELAAQNLGSRAIAGILAKKEYRNRKGGLLAEQTIRRILRNPLYKGTAVMHRQHRDFESRKVEQLGRDQWIYHEGVVPSIVTDEMWEKVNTLMDQRRAAVCQKEISAEAEGETVFRGRKQNQYPLSGRICCGICGSMYWRRTHRLVSGIQHYWSCSRFLTAGKGESGCCNLHMKETDLEAVLKQVGEAMEQSCQVDQIMVNPSGLMIYLKDQREIPVTVKKVSYRKREYHVCL